MVFAYVYTARSQVAVAPPFLPCSIRAFALIQIIFWSVCLRTKQLLHLVFFRKVDPDVLLQDLPRLEFFPQ